MGHDVDFLGIIASPEERRIQWRRRPITRSGPLGMQRMVSSDSLQQYNGGEDGIVLAHALSVEKL